MTIEYAAAGLSDAAVREKLRYAEPHVRAAVDRSRKHRGLSPLWSTEIAALPSAGGSLRGRGERSWLPPRVLVGIAAAGISVPSMILTEAVAMPEIIAPSAWASVQRDLQAGKTFDFRLQHHGRVIVRSDDSRVTLKIDPIAGLLFTIEDDWRGMPWPAGCWCSISFQLRDHGFRCLGGRMVREIRSMRLGHIALLSPARGEHPAYPLAKVRSVKPENAARESIRLLVDTRLAVKEMGL
jgi:hypothetical protein